ncbi:MAG: NADP-dependent oxidoreductase [Alphaproteobacteria bacterium]
MRDSATQWIVRSRPNDQVSLANFEQRTVPVDEPGDGEFGIETLYLTVSPPARMWLTSGGLTGVPVPVGGVMRGSGIGRVVGSRHPGFADGDIVSGALGWTDYTLSDGAAKMPVQKIAAPDGLPLTTAMHVLGGTGATAYFGLYEFGLPRVGDMVLVSAAAGSVGAIVCQLAKMAGCKVVGIAGSDAKCAWLTDTLGMDGAINYKREDVAIRIKDLCPNGIDIFFDNVGGETLDAALDNIAHGARVVLCGGTSQYDQEAEWLGPKNYFNLVYKEATMRGFYIFSFAARFGESRDRLGALLRAGSLTYNEDILEGIDSAPEALLRVLAGENFGTQLIKVAD